MAQSKSFFGMRRGSTKTLTFQVNKGKQITKDRVYEVSNPKTFYQMKQRASFSKAVKFYKHAVANFFKFAFEDKKQDESDYNAFMRYNVSRSTVISADASKSDVYPALGNWLLSKGSIPSAVITPSGSTAFALAVTENELSTTSWSEVSRLIASKYDLVEGDVVTFVHVVAMGATVSNMPALVVPTELEGVKWEIEQRVIGATNEDDTLPFNSTLNATELSFAFNNAEEINYAQGFAIVFSRPTAASLKVSTSEIIPSLTAKSIMYKAMKRDWIKAALTTWEATGDAILQGSLLKEAEVTTNLEVSALTFNFPFTLEDYEELYRVEDCIVTFSRPVTEVDMLEGRIGLETEQGSMYSFVKNTEMGDGWYNGKLSSNVILSVHFDDSRTEMTLRILDEENYKPIARIVINA